MELTFNISIYLLILLALAFTGALYDNYSKSKSYLKGNHVITFLIPIIIVVIFFNLISNDQLILDWNLILEFSRVVFAWPPIIGIIVLVTLSTFKEPIANKIRDIKSTKWGDGEVSFHAGQTQSPPIDPPPSLPENLINDSKALDQIQAAKESPEEYVAEHKRVSLALNFERMYSRMYGTQVQLLLAFAKTGGLTTKSIMMEKYMEHINRTGRTDNYSLYDFLKYLIECKLLNYDNDTPTAPVELTKLGFNFVEYITTQYKNELLEKRW